MRVLSLFDGISIAQQALKELGVKDLTYYASEIDKYAISLTQKNFPNTIQLGDVKKIETLKDFDTNKYLNYKKENIDLLIGGSPCQNDEAAMECVLIYPYMDAVFNYSDTVVKMWKNKENITGVIVHEMCHLITDPLYIKGDRRYSSQTEILDEREKLTDFISKLVLKIK